MMSLTETELKFAVPSAFRAALTAEMSRGTSPAERATMAATYLDTEDRRLAKAGLAWRLRREGRRWIQMLKSPESSALERFEHEVIRPDATHDANEHAGTVVGDRLIRILRAARADGLEVQVRFRTDVKRILRRLRTRGAVVEIAFDEGRIVSNGSSLRIREVEFELVSGSVTAMIAVAERWRKRFDLVYEPRSKAERGYELATGSRSPPVRKAVRLDYPRHAGAGRAFAAVLDECLSHLTRNAIGLLENDPGTRAERVHQMRVGIRRLRSALRSFDGWTPAPPVALVSGLRDLFAELGRSRDSDVLQGGVAAELARVGAPALALSASDVQAEPDPIVCRSETQRLILAWIAWRTTLAEEAEPAHGSVPRTSQAEGRGDQPADPPADRDPSYEDPQTFHRSAERRIRRWHRRVVADWEAFDNLDDAGLHALRKRVKRLRYAIEFFAPALRRREIERCLNSLTAVQDRMGQLNDLFVARSRYQPLVESDPAAWFALGWITARIAEVRALVKPELGQLAEAKPPSSCASGRS